MTRATLESIAALLPRGSTVYLRGCHLEALRDAGAEMSIDPGAQVFTVSDIARLFLAGVEFVCVGAARKATMADMARAGERAEREDPWAA